VRSPFNKHMSNKPYTLAYQGLQISSGLWETYYTSGINKTAHQAPQQTRKSHIYYLLPFEKAIMRFYRVNLPVSHNGIMTEPALRSPLKYPGRYHSGTRQNTRTGENKHHSQTNSYCVEGFCIILCVPLFIVCAFI